MHLITIIKNTVKQLYGLLTRLAGYRLLTKEQTVAYLAPYELARQEAQPLGLPEVRDAATAARVVFERRQLLSELAHVWQFTPGVQLATLLRNGSLLVGSDILCTDYFHPSAVLQDQWATRRRQPVAAPTLVAPFSHYQSPTQFWGYYDFLFLVAAKICRILHAAPALAPGEAVVCYPLLGTSYEREFLAAVGFGSAQVLDSRLHAVRFARCLLANASPGFYPTPQDVQVLRQRLAPLIRPVAHPPTRLYISRAGRRRVANEEALLALLAQYGFTVVADQPRTLAEQLTLYHQAAVVLGPHGASFANCIWCQPGTHLIELFSANYAPDYFQYLAHLSGLTYSALLQPPADSHSLPLEQNMLVSLPDLARTLAELLGPAPSA